MLKFTPILLTLLVGFNFVYCKHDLEVGAHQQGDRLVRVEEVRFESSLIGRKVVEEKEFYVPQGYVLTLVKAIDLASGDDGAEVVVNGGGPGTDRVKLRFKSQRFEGVFHRIELYAKPI